MERDIRRQKIRMLIVTLGVLGLIVWNTDFVMRGIEANIYLNGTIILVFLFGFALVFRHVFDLEGEQVALKALKEAYSDAKIIDEKDFLDEYWRHHRCMKPAIVYQRPRLLGHIFELTYDEILRTNKIRITLTTMQSLMDGIETRISEQRSLTVYITGLLVFLGLIGTFIGLMDMVASVGGIIGSLQSATADGGDQAAAFSKLITDLEAPLVGMATGFSSSLFGLFGSLIIGLLSRFGARATNALKLHFEEWLASVAQIENEEYVPEEDDTARGPVDEEGLKRLTGSVKVMMEGFERVNNEFMRTMGMIQGMAEAQEAQNKLIEAQTERLDSLAHMQHLLSSMGDHMKAMMEIFEKSAAENRTVGQELKRDVTAGIAGLAHVLGEMNASNARDRQADAEERKATLRFVTEMQSSIRENMAGLERSLSDLGYSNSEISGALSRLANGEERSLSQSEHHHRELLAALGGMRLARQPSQESTPQPSYSAMPSQPYSAPMKPAPRPAAEMPRQAPKAPDMPRAEIVMDQVEADPLAAKIAALEKAVKTVKATAAIEEKAHTDQATGDQLINEAKAMQEDYAAYAKRIKEEEELRRSYGRNQVEEAAAAHMSPIERLRALYRRRGSE